MHNKKQELLDKLGYLKEYKQKIELSLKEDQKKILFYEKSNKMLYFNTPNKGYLGSHGKWEYNSVQKEFFSPYCYYNPKIKIITLTGANRISKTFTSFNAEMTAMFGKKPWDPHEEEGAFWDLMRWEPPIKIRWVGQDWEKHIKTVLEPKFDELWPKSRQVEVKKNNNGVRAYIKDLHTGSTIEIMSNNQESDLFEGWNGHMVVYDEPPKRDVRVACARGLVDFKGRELFAMTLLKEAWVDKEVINSVLEDGTPDPTVYNITADISVNVGFGIDQEGVDQFAKTLTEDEKSARIRGVPSYKAGLILNIDKKVHMLERFEIPSHWPVDVAIDIHPAKPQHILFKATDERNLKYICFEIVGHGDGNWVADQIIKKADRFSLRINRIIIDPLSKGDSNNENSTFDKIRDGLSRFGYSLQVASKDKEDGIIILNEMLMSKNNIPGLFFFRDLKHFINHATGWMYDENGKPSKEEDDQCENLYRLALLNTQYFEENSSIEEEEYLQYESSKRTKNEVTGY